MCSARARSSAGAEKKYWVTVFCVSALKEPPMAAEISDSWSAERPGLPRNIMCSWAWASPGNAAGSSLEPTR